MSILAALTLGVSISIAALAVDLGNGFVMRSRLQATADAAALAGLLEMPEGATALRGAETAAIVAAAQTFSTTNMGTMDNGTVLENKDILIGHWDGAGTYGARRTFYLAGSLPGGATYNAVQVSTRRSNENGNSLALLFPGILGRTNIGVSAQAIAALGETGNGDGCVIALNTEERVGIKISGTADVHLGCSIVSNSPVDQGGNSCLWATGVSAIDSIEGNCLLNPLGEAPVELTYLPHEVADPLCEDENNPDTCLQEPATTAACQRNVDVRPGETAVFTGNSVYCGDVQIQGTAIFEPGLHHIKDGKFHINSGADVTGAGVTFFLESTHKNDIFEINGHSDVTLRAPTEQEAADNPDISNDLIGMLFFQTRGASPQSVHKFNGGSTMDLSGIIYTPSAGIRFNGGSDVALGETVLGPDNDHGLMIISGTVDFIGNTGILDTALSGSAGNNPHLRPISSARLVQ